MNQVQSEFMKHLKKFARMVRIPMKNKEDLFRLLGADIAGPEKVVELQKELMELMKKPSVIRMIKDMFGKH